jgi:hypothetical protein
LADRGSVVVAGIFKACVGAALVAGLALMWTNRQPVVDAYRLDGTTAVDVQLSGIDLDIELAAVGPSPYLLDPAPDTRSSVPMALTVQPPRDPVPQPSLWGGSAVIRGVVTGPDGPLPGATVRVERHTSTGMASTQVETDEEGHWELRSVQGGRYRVRAWLVGQYTMNGSEVLFLSDDQRATFDLTIAPVDPGPHLSFTYWGDLYLGHTGTVAASVTTRTVGDDGVVTIDGVPGAVVTLAPSSGLVALPGEVRAGPDGVARFELRCDRLGASVGVVQYQNRRATFTLPDCVPVPPPPPPPEPEDDAGADGPGADEPGADDASAPTAAPVPPPTHQDGVVEVLGLGGGPPDEAASATSADGGPSDG